MTYVDSHAAAGQRRALITAEQRASLRELGRRRSPALFRLLTSPRGIESDPLAILPGPYRLGSCDTSGADAYCWQLMGREVHMAAASRVMRRQDSHDIEACQAADEPGVLSVWYPDPHDPAGRWQDYPINRSVGFKD